MRLIDLRGRKINNLFVIRRVNNKGKETVWRCKCDCGKMQNIYGRHLRDGTAIDCGCRRKERHARSKWGKLNPNYKKYVKEAGGRCRAERWFNKSPCQVCGNKKSEIHHIDGRTDNNKLSNIMFLCRRHHMEVDGRLEKLKDVNIDRKRDDSGRFLSLGRQ